MTKRPQKRDNQYYLDRLRDEHPGAYADLQAGKFKNVSQALVAVGLKKARSHFDLLSSTWAKASPAERDAFKVLIGCVAPAPVSVTPMVVRPAITPPTLARPVKGIGHLTPGLAAEVRAIMDRRKLTQGEVMRELGLKSLNASLGRALGRGDRIQNTLITALEAWVDKHRAP